MNSPVILAFDTAMAGCSAAVLRGDGRVAALSEPMTRGQSERLLPMICEVLAAAKIGYSDLAAIATTTGPGAFTGLRIGIAAARALGTALGVPVIGVATPDVLAAQYGSGRSPFVVVLETKRSDFYGQFFDEKAVPESEVRTMTANDLAGLIEPGRVAIGDGAARVLLESGRDPAGAAAGFELADPAILAVLARDLFIKNEGQYPHPIYLREADVSVSKQRVRPIV